LTQSQSGHAHEGQKLWTNQESKPVVRLATGSYNDDFWTVQVM